MCSARRNPRTNSAEGARWPTLGGRREKRSVVWFGTVNRRLRRGYLRDSVRMNFRHSSLSAKPLSLSRVDRLKTALSDQMTGGSASQRNPPTLGSKGHERRFPFALRGRLSPIETIKADVPHFMLTKSRPKGGLIQLQVFLVDNRLVIARPRRQKCGTLRICRR